MELYIRKKQIINLYKEFGSFSGPTLPISKEIVNDNINIRFYTDFTYDGFETGKDLTIRITLSELQTIAVITAREYVSDTVLYSSSVDTENVITFKINTSEPEVKFTFFTVPEKYFNITKLEIIEDEFKLGTIDADINIVKSFYNDADALFEAYTKTFKLFKTEFTNLDVNSLYDAIIIRKGVTLLEGEMELTDYNDNEFYSAVVKKPVNVGLTNIKELKLKDYDFDFDIEYNITDYISKVGTVTDKYNYYISRENNVDDGFLKSNNKMDFTATSIGDDIPGYTYWKQYTDDFNFNTYVRPAISMPYLFELAHSIAGYTYELPTIYKFEELAITGDFSNKLDSISDKRTMDFFVDRELYEQSDEGTWLITDLPLVFDNGSAIIPGHFISDTDINNEFTIQLTKFGENAQFSGVIKLWVLDSSHNLVEAIWSDSLPTVSLVTSTGSIAKWENIDPIKIKYHYAEYGYALTLSVYCVDVDGATSGQLTIRPKANEEHNTISYNPYNLQLENSTIEAKSLFQNNELSFLDIIKSVMGVYNLQPILIGNHIKYIHKEDAFDNVKSDLTKNVDFNSFKKTFNGLSTILNKYDDTTVNSEINFNGFDLLNIKSNEKLTKTIPMSLIYENNNGLVSDDQFYNVDFSAFLDEKPYYELGDDLDVEINFRFDILKGGNPNISNSLMFITYKSLPESVSIRNWAGDTIHTASYLNDSRTFNPQYGLWFNKNDGATLYKYNDYADIGDVETTYDVFHQLFNDRIYSDYEEYTADVYHLSSIQIRDILAYGIVIIGSYKYIIKELTISNKKSQIILLKID